MYGCNILHCAVHVLSWGPQLYTHFSTHSITYSQTHTHTNTGGPYRRLGVYMGGVNRHTIQRNKQRMVLNKAFATQTNVCIHTNRNVACLHFLFSFICSIFSYVISLWLISLFTLGVINVLLMFLYIMQTFSTQ